MQIVYNNIEYGISPQSISSFSEGKLFGYIRPNIPELRVREKLRYDAWYCGLCARLGREYGLVARACLSYDCTFLAIMLGSLEEESVSSEIAHCPFKPLGKKKPIIKEASPALGYAAAVCVLLAKYKLDDDIADGKKLRAAAKPPLLPAYKKAKKNFPAVDSILKKKLRELAEIEARRESDPDIPANAFGELLAEVLLAYKDFGAETSLILRDLGLNIGRFIYLIDAFDDMEKDKKHGLYNPFLLSGTVGKDAEFLINISINNAVSAYDLLNTKHDNAITANIITEGLFAALDNCIGRTDSLRKDAPQK